MSDVSQKGDCVAIKRQDWVKILWCGTKNEIRGNKKDRCGPKKDQRGPKRNRVALKKTQNALRTHVAIKCSNVHRKRIHSRKKD